jgi:hypothetical protein
MVKCFGYHLVAVGREGVNAFFVHESAAGKDALLSLEDAQRQFAGGAEFPMIHGQCVRQLWVEVDTRLDYARPSLSPSDLPVVMLSHKPGGARSQQRIFYSVAVMGMMPGSIGLQFVHNHGTKPMVAPARNTVAPSLDSPMQLMLLGLSFLCGALFLHFVRFVLGSASKRQVAPAKWLVPASASLYESLS